MPTIRGIGELSGPKTTAARIRAQSVMRNRRFRERKREGYALAGPVDIPPEFISVMVKTGDLDADLVTEDGDGVERVDRDELNEAWARFLERLVVKADELVDFLSEDDVERRITNLLFCQELGLPISAPRMRFDVVEEHANKAGYEIRFRKSKKHREH